MKICFYTLLSILFLCSFRAYGQGKLLRGEQWEKFPDTLKTADFFVAPDGNDSWSGTLAAPNTDRTDGPFASISRAQDAVRTLKTVVFAPKSEPVETIRDHSLFLRTLPLKWSVMIHL